MLLAPVVREVPGAIARGRRVTRSWGRFLIMAASAGTSDDPTVGGSDSLAYPCASTHDRWGRLQRQWAVASATTPQPVVGSGYTYNTAGQRIRQDLGDGTSWTYTYDRLGQLASAQRRWPDGALVAGQQYGYLYDDIGNRKDSREGGDAISAGLQTTSYTTNLLNQYTSIVTPGVASVNGLANATNGVTVNGTATVRQGEYWWKQTSVNNASAPVWASLNVAASNGGSTNTTVNRYVSAVTQSVPPGDRPHEPQPPGPRPVRRSSGTATRLPGTVFDHSVAGSAGVLGTGMETRWVWVTPPPIALYALTRAVICDCRISTRSIRASSASRCVRSTSV